MKPLAQLLVLVISGSVGLTAQPSALKDLFHERLPTMAVLTFTVEQEEERSPVTVVGTVIDDEGRIVVLGSAVPTWLPPDWLTEFKLHLPGEPGDGHALSYLGMDHLTEWHFFQAGEGIRDQLRPITDFGSAEVDIGDEVWGIWITDEAFDYKAGLAAGRVAFTHPLPFMIASTEEVVGSPGAPVFTRTGAFAGWVGNSLNEERILSMQGEQARVGLRNPRKSTVFLLAHEFDTYSKRLPPAVDGGPRTWLGVTGMQPIDRDTAAFFDLQGQGALVVGELITNGPAAEAGLQTRDIVVSVEGEPLPKFTPEGVLLQYFEHEIQRRDPGEEITLGVLRGQGKAETVTVTLGTSPTLANQARRQYFEGVGLSVREFLLQDAVARRILETGEEGAVVVYVRPNSPAASAGVEPGDWIQEIDGETVETYADAIAKLEKVEADDSRRDLVLMVRRENDTKVLPIKLQ